jgi:hypothetical protein
MKINFTLAFLFLIGKFIFAQDTIVKINNEIIQAKIIEITPNEIKYKKFSFQDGPTYIENKTDVQYVKYSNGLKEQFAKEKPKPVEEQTTTDYYNPNAVSSAPTSLKMEPYGSRYKYQGRKISEKEMQETLMKTQDKQIIGLVQTAKDARKFSYIGYAAFPLGLASLIVLGQAQTSGGLAAGTFLFFGAIACPIVSGIYSHKRKISNHKAVELYNQKF